jgi:hypothetical protein
VRILGASTCVYVPPVHCDRSPGPHWTRPVVAGRVLTRSRQLHFAMQSVIGAEFGAGAAS